MRFLVTGANGFIGSHLTRALVARGHEVRALVRRTSDTSLLQGLPLELAYADVTEPDSLVPAVEGVGCVFHLAGATAAADTTTFDCVNRMGTMNVLAAVRKQGSTVRRFVLVSSAAAAGPSDPVAPKTEDAPAAPVSRYGHSKLAAERVVKQMAGRVPTTVVRPPLVYGSGDAVTLGFFKLVKRRIVLSLSGPERRLSFVHVGDLVEGMLLAAMTDAGRGETFNLTGPEVGTAVQFQRAIADAMGVRTVEVPVPRWVLWLAGTGSDVLNRSLGRSSSFSSDKVRDAVEKGWVLSGEKAQRLLGYEPVVGFREGIREALSWYREHRWL
jgi:nucleoside-diphosphate-sugar epimerase